MSKTLKALKALERAAMRWAALYKRYSDNYGYCHAQDEALNRACARHAAKRRKK